MLALELWGSGQEDSGSPETLQLSGGGSLGTREEGLAIGVSLSPKPVPMELSHAPLGSLHKEHSVGLELP